ncbi:MAG: hypothetical protein HXY39_13055 [Chloroflexi bacterium]|nr:hypothetical protein [Chloroflexota bacterium]
MLKRALILPGLVLVAGVLAMIVILAMPAAGPVPVAAQQAYPAPATPPPPAYPAPATALPAATPVSPVRATATPAPATATKDATATAVPAMPTRTPVPTRVPPTAAQVAQAVVPTPASSDALICVPGQTMIVTGVAPPRAPLLLLFGTRVVGGGSATASGDFALPLTFGVERAGVHTITVQVRGARQVVQTLTCEMPPTTPTPVVRRTR